MKPAPDFDTAAFCFHCGLPVPAGSRWAATIDGNTRAMCCPGCQAVAEAIVSTAGSDYYRNRSDYSATASGRDDLVPAQLQAIDVAAQESAGTSCEAVFSIEGIRCAACVWLIQHRLGALTGMQSVSMNVSAEKLYVQWDSQCCRPSQIIQALHQIGYTAHPYDALEHGDRVRRSSKQLFRQLFIAGLSMMQVMMYAFPSYLSSSFTIEEEHAQLLRWASLFLTLPAVCYSALPFYRGAWFSLRGRSLGMDVPVTLGILAAFGASAIATWNNRGDVYFDSVTMFIFLLLCSRYLEMAARRKAFERLEKMQRTLPVTACRLADYPLNQTEELVSANQLRIDDVILIRSGEAISADCTIISGATAIDASLLSGESRPLPKEAGDELPGGAINIQQAVIARVLRVAEGSRLSALIRLTERAGMNKRETTTWVGQLASWFVATQILLSVLFFALWQMIDPARSWPIAIAILVVSCPCALALATPSALASAADRMLGQGILLMRTGMLETLPLVTHVIFDKTGTLTIGKPAIRHIQTYSTLSASQCLQLAAGLESGSQHPLGEALKQAQRASLVEDGCDQERMQAFATETHTEPGKGLQGSVKGVSYRLGSKKYIEELLGYAIPEKTNPQFSSIYLAGENSCLARFDMQDAARDEAATVVRQLRDAGKEVILLSGDDQQIAQNIACKLGISTVYGNQLPEQKLQFVQNLQRSGAVVAMIGDGINDAAVLRAADASFAMGNGAAMAQVNADAVLLSENLDSVLNTFSLARATGSVIRQNLLWAGVYNLIAIPAAACGYVSPLWSGVGMAASSMIVVVNALSLRKLHQIRKMPPNTENNGRDATTLPAMVDQKA